MDRSRLRELERMVLGMKDAKFLDLPQKLTCYSPEYVGFHSRRFAVLLMMLEQIGIHPKSRILDVGPTFTSILFAQQFECTVDSLSFSEDEPTPFGKNFQFDLNLSQNREDWRTDFGDYEAIVFAEVIEHLHTAPRVVLEYLKERLRPGGWLIIQTPNALGVKQRIQVLTGRHPYEEISADPTSPNHFRESTLPELTRYCTQAGLEVVHAGYYNYFNPTYRQKRDATRPWMGALFFRASDLLPAKLKRGMTVVCRRSEDKK